MEPVTFEVKITQNDYMRFNYWVSAARQKRLVLTILAGVLLLALLGVGIWIYTFTTSLLALILIVVVPLLLIVQFVSGWRRVKKSYAGNKDIQQPISYTFKKEKITMDGPAGQGEYTKDMIAKTFITKNYIYIWLTTKRFIIIPKRFIPAGREQAVLESIKD